MRGLLLLYPSGTINAAADGAPPRWIGNSKFKKNSLPVVPRRGPDTEVLRIEDDFYGSGVSVSTNPIFKII